MRSHKWISGYGQETVSEVLATFIDDGKKFVIVRCGRGRYDAAEPYTVLPAKS